MYLGWTQAGHREKSTTLCHTFCVQGGNDFFEFFKGDTEEKPKHVNISFAAFKTNFAYIGHE